MIRALAATNQDAARERKLERAMDKNPPFVV